MIGNIFERINRNVSKLTPQELRHAKFSGVFNSTAKNLTNWMSNVLDKNNQNFPKIDIRSKKQMKDIELVAQLLLFLEEGAKSYSSDYLDKAFSDRDIEWDKKDKMETEFRSIIEHINEILKVSAQVSLAKTRLKNQADFYSLLLN